MTNRYAVLVCFFLFSCSGKDQKVKEIVKTSHNQPVRSIQRSNIPALEDKISLDLVLVEKEFEDLLQNNSTKKVKTQEHGGGDCYGGYSIFQNKGLNQKLILDKLDCGDYGFSNKQFLLSNEKLKRVKTFKFEYNGIEGEATIFEVEEHIYYFNGNQVLLRSRKKYTKDFSDTLLTGLNFIEKLIPGDSVYQVKYKELKEILASTLLED